MQVNSVNNINLKNNYNASFTGLKIPDFNKYTKVVRDEFIKDADEIPDIFQSFIDEAIPPISKEATDTISKLYKKYQKENEMIFRSALKPEVVDIAQKITDLPTYGNYLLPFLTDKPKFDLEYLYNLAKKRDILGEMRIPGDAFPYFSEIPYERLKILEPLMLSKNDAGMWNYGPSFIWNLDNKYSNEQLEIMSRLAKYKVHGMNLCKLAQNPYLDHWNIVEKSKSINDLFGKDLREISFFTTSWGDNYISIDVQLPHIEGKPDYQNFKRIYAKIGDNEQPEIQNRNVPKIDKYIKNIYTKLEDKLCVFTADKLNNSIIEVLDNVPWAKEIDVLRVMQKLTQFANYNSLEFISKELTKENIDRILNLNEGINSSFNYFHESKGIIDLPKQKGRNFGALFVTKEDLQNNNFLKDIKQLSQYSDIKFINLEGWSDSINLFNDENLLTRKTIKVLKNTRKIMEKYPQYSFNEALNKILNNKIESYLAKNGIQCHTINSDAPATRRVILEQMRPIMPNESMLKSTVETVANYYTKNKKKHEKLAVKIAKYYDQTVDIYSKQRMIENLKELKGQIINFAKENNIKKENIYLVSPITEINTAKSFDIVNNMFSQILNIPKDRILRIRSFEKIKDMPENSIFIIADDITASGYSMVEAAGYNDIGREISDKKHILFCPISAATEGTEHIEYVINQLGRNSKDKILLAKNALKCYDNTTDDFVGKENTTFYKKVFGYYRDDEMNSTGMCTSFPYMAPDNNSNLSAFLVKFFTPKSECIKSKSLNFSKLEKDVYYYNIFGTDEKHVPTKFKKESHLYGKLKDKISKFFNIF